MNKNRKILIAAVAVVALVAILLGVWFVTRPAAAQGSKTITVEVVHKDGSEKSFTCRTDEAYLGPVLEAEGLAQGEEGPYGLFITVVDGERAVYEEDGAYWAVMQGGEFTPLGVDETPIQDGDVFSLVYTRA